MKIPVLLVEDHALVAASLVVALAPVDVEVISTGPRDVAELVATAREHECRLALVDLDLGRDVHGAELVPALCAAGLRVVILSGTNDRTEVARAYEAGAVAFISKQESFTDLVNSVRHVAAGHELQPRADRLELVRQLRESRRHTSSRLAPFEQLTRREREILAGLCRGYTAHELASDAVVAVSTIRTHIRGVLTKLGVGTQVAAVALARELGWDPAVHAPRGDR